MRRIDFFAFLSGAGVLIAQISWNRQLMLLTGGSVDSTAIVLSAFMLGIGFGGAYFGRKSELSRNPVNLLRVVAGGTALFSFIPLVASPLASAIYPAFYHTGFQMPFRFLLALALILPVTFFAGGIVPVMAKLSEGQNGTSRASKLYGLNSLGSAIGGGISGFILLETVGVTLTLAVGALLTVIALLMVKSVKRGVCECLPTSGNKPRSFLHWIYFGSGAIALCWEMVWARRLTFTLGNSTYAFATMGVMFLLGIGSGSIIGRKYAKSSRVPLVSFGIVQVLLGLASVIPLTALGSFSSLSRLLSILPGPSGNIAGGIAAAFFFMMPSAILMGASFPIILKAVARENKLGEDVGTLNLANCIGAAVGPILASQLFFRYLGVSSTVLVLACLNATVGFLAFWKSGKLKMGIISACSVAVSAILVLSATAPGSKPPEGMELVYFSEGRTATVAVFRRAWDDHRSMKVNGIEEVPVDQASLEAFYLLGHLPWGYNPSAGNVMAVAMGGGITSGAILTHPVDTLICVEICPEVIEAAEYFQKENNRPDLDDRFELIRDDGRNYLLGTGNTFDLIICDATHPGSSESWVLYTEEFYSIVLSRLQNMGIAAQWVPLHRLPQEEYYRILATWSRIFPYSAVHSAGGRHAVLIGSSQPLVLDVGAMFQDTEARNQLESVGFRENEEFFIQPVLTTDELLALAESDVRSNTDDLAPCQFMLKKTPGDPQLTIGENMSLMLALDSRSESHPVHVAQVLYWSMRLPDATEALRMDDNQTAMGRRWLAVALSTGAELLYNEGRYGDALELAGAALQVDSHWQKNLDLVLEINRAQSILQEDN